MPAQLPHPLPAAIQPHRQKHAPESRDPDTRSTPLRAPEGRSAGGRKAGSADQLPGPTARREHPQRSGGPAHAWPSLSLRLPPVHGRIPAALLVPRAMSNTPLRPVPRPRPSTICLADRGGGQGLDGALEAGADERTGGTQDRRRGHATTPSKAIDDRQAVSVHGSTSPGALRVPSTPGAVPEGAATQGPAGLVCEPGPASTHDGALEGRPGRQLRRSRAGPGLDPGAMTPDMRARPHRPAGTGRGRPGRGGRPFLPAPRQLPGRGGTGCFPAVPAVAESGSFTPMVRRWSGRRRGRTRPRGIPGPSAPGPGIPLHLRPGEPSRIPHDVTPASRVADLTA